MAKNDTLNHDYDNEGTATADRIADLGATASEKIDNAPLIALGAGLAIGAVLAAVLPASEKERDLLGPYGRKLNDAGTGAIDRGRGLAKQKFDEMAGDKLRDFLGNNGSGTTSA